MALVHSSALNTYLDRLRYEVNLSIKFGTVQRKVCKPNLGFGLQQLAIGRNIPYIHMEITKYILFIADFFFTAKTNTMKDQPAYQRRYLISSNKRLVWGIHDTSLPE